METEIGRKHVYISKKSREIFLIVDLFCEELSQNFPRKSISNEPDRIQRGKGTKKDELQS